MAKETEERVRIKALVKGEAIVFPIVAYLKISRMVADLNRAAKVDREIEKEEVKYSLQKEGAPLGKFFVIRRV